MPRAEDLSSAVSDGDTDRLRACLEGDPGLIHLKDKDGCTALIAAARDGCLDVVHLLVEHGADLEAREPTYERTALAWATFYGHRDVVQYLIERGADVNAMDAYGYTPLKTATMGSEGAWREWVSVRPTEYEAIAAMLRERGASEKHE
jgi:ankyrin repeat protein